MSVRTQKIKEEIELILRERLRPTYLEIQDESWKHEGHAAAGGGGHFQLTVVSKCFEGVNLISRNRLVFDTLRTLMQSDIHALSIKAKTPEEWSGSNRNSFGGTDSDLKPEVG